ncbi:hypothetical protein MVES_003149 [Malassezia vespertilionis]|uniref:N-acetyltransferase domain-containing protein n=2 Tax=Malassezia vespertilionis TaxID=2020962 RepID=A0A2N1J903_9BASI|nr:hypothetical protein MVES_003149 [Malassezia vespertilionis]
MLKQRSRTLHGSARTETMGKENANRLVQNLVFDVVKPDELRAAQAIESAFFPREEVSSLEQLIHRQQEAPQLFFGAFVPLTQPIAGPLSVTLEGRRKLIAFCSATIAPADVVRGMYATSHSHLARVVCIHDFCVESGNRRQGIGTSLMSKFLARLRAMVEKDPAAHPYEVVSVVCPYRRIPFFEHCYFRFRGASYLPKGIDPWFELRLELQNPTRQEAAFAEADIAAWKDARASCVNTRDFHPYKNAQHTSSSDDKAGSPLFLQGTKGNHDLSSSAQWGLGTYSVSPTENENSINTDQVLSELLAKGNISNGLARDLGLPATNGHDAARTNPGKPLSAIFGEAVAAKTASEDSIAALVARIVKRADNLNIARLYCPNGQCDCQIFAPETAEWVVKELGPLSDVDAEQNSGETPNLDTEEFHDRNSAPFVNAPWVGPSFDSSPGPSIGPVRGFWYVSSPMKLYNVSFSKNVRWRVPEPTMSRSSSRRESGSSSDHKRERSLRGNFSNRKNTLQPLEPLKQEANMPWSLELTPGEEVLLKFIMCPDCSCGPLGFMILPEKCSVEALAGQGYSEQGCYVAAHRLCYDL